MSRTHAFVFVCQGGELEIKASLLAASLRRHLKCEYELIAAVPGPARGIVQPRSDTISFLRQLGARIVPIANLIDPTYPIANKIDCLRIKSDADKLVFVDSDMILLRDFGDQSRFAIPFNARPASCATFTGGDETWREIYRACGAPMPTTRIRTTHSGEYVLPYFNSAFIGVPGKSGFGDAWLECGLTIDAMRDVPDKRPYLDQISLGVAAAKLGMEMDCLDEAYNHPINFKPLNERKLPYFCHYHDAATLAREPAALAVLRSLVQEHDGLGAILEAEPPWAALASGRGAKTACATPELIITGIARSGTSYLCNLLHRLDNTVVLNEPIEAPQALMQEGLPWGLARFFRDVRRDVNAGTPIRNKLVDGKVTEDTALGGEVQTYAPRVVGPDFVLGVKATVAFLSRLPSLRQVMPNARFVACVRDPLDTIASWKGTFEHLRNADVSGLNVGDPNDPWLSGVQRKELSSIAAIPDAPSRRAAWWSYLAGLVLESKDHLILVRYDELAQNPQAALERIMKGWPGGKAKEPIAPSEIRRRRQNLDADDYAAIGALCRNHAEALGLGGEDSR
ncbi:MAG: sulfotransferase [Planctomycetota bacterium]|nr:sulfotransferase [Planctomycetota bacterium]